MSRGQSLTSNLPGLGVSSKHLLLLVPTVLNIMGIGKQFVQSLIFNSINSDDTGLIIQNEMLDKPHVIIFDHMLVMHSTCFIPLPGSERDDGSLRQHILQHSIKYYTKYFKSHGASDTLFVLCEDGKQCVKPAVRDKRNEHVPTEALKFFKRNSGDLAKELLEFLRMEAIRTLHISGFNTHSGVSCNLSGPGGKTVPDLKLQNFTSSCTEAESDTLMFAFAAHYRSLFPHHLIMIATKDSDVIPSALAITTELGGEILGNTVVEFKTTMLSFLKDFDRAMGDYKNVDRMTPEDTRRLTSYSRQIASGDFVLNERMTLSINPQLLYFALDTSTLEPFDNILQALEAKYFTDQSLVPKYARFITRCCAAGFRGAVFRRILMRMVDETPETEEKVLEFMDSLGTPGVKPADCLKAFLGTTPSYCAVTRQVRPQQTFFGGEVREEVDGSDAFMMCSRGVSGSWHRQGGGCTYQVRETPMTPKAIRLTLALAGAYLAKKLPFGTYGRFVLANTTSGVKYIRFLATPRARAAVVGAVMAGSDYNLTIPQMGIAQLAALMGDPGFIEMCQKLPLTRDGEGVSHMKRILAFTRIKTKWHDQKTVDDLFDCAWRTLCYTVDTWTMKSPAPSTEYGFVLDGSVWRFAANLDPALKKSFELRGKIH
uniref:ORF54 n=1 Tax=Latid herpesvirus 1 TaxID=3096545 RepID=A0AB33V6U3_9VIRU